MKRVEKFEGVINGVKYNCKKEFVKALENLQNTNKDIKEIRYGTTVSYEEDLCPLPSQPTKKMDLDYLLPDWNSIEKAIDKIKGGTVKESDEISANIEANMAEHLRNLVQNSNDWAQIKEDIMARAEAVKDDCKNVCDCWDDDRIHAIESINRMKDDLHKTDNVIKFLSDYAGYAECVYDFFANRI